ncbi:putative membrane-associated zinc metalloprotease [Melioribacter roseus P3M-2]|uniref:Zinc metalloprotease n=1 Tax=Melioribacter roseus (strain DSM 23840 / JCM 17771 / VKM B-2668 / P3M-2) TaxID=1191523 RepID=I6ZY18_MELRP|nr:RIP metalloprotease RseP [Melioribacter roseus]AFN73903.1 putative membrane-associated zinc metalloprotease [Melioribacter roseus P3M-2]
MDYIIYFAITIGILVFVHEFGHFAAAKLSKMRVDIFAIGFGKRLFGWNKITGFTLGDLPEDWDGNGHTDYRLCLFPLGGYVKIAGMIDESFDTKFTESEPQPYEFRSKSTLQKLFVISAGVIMNLALTLMIFWGINYFQGKQVIKSTTVDKVVPGSVAEEAGFRSYDKILKINDAPVKNWEDVISRMLIQSQKNINVTVLRDNREISLTIPHNVIAENSQEGFFIYPYPTKPYIQDVVKDSPAEEAGIQPGDIFLAINNIELTDRERAVELISSNPGAPLEIKILRNQDTLLTKVTPAEDGKIGIVITDIYSGDFDVIKYGALESLTHSISNIGNYTMLTFSLLKKVITGNIAFNQAFGGPVKIAQFAAKSADSGIMSFLLFLAMLSLSLAIINILPFPALDGGHLLIILVEGILRRELPVKVKIAIQNAGFIILLMLMAFIIYSDLISL